MTLEKNEYPFLEKWMELRLATEIFWEEKRDYRRKSGQNCNSEEKEVGGGERGARVFSDGKSAFLQKLLLKLVTSQVRCSNGLSIQTFKNDKHLCL